MIKVKDYNHVGIIVRHLEECKKFYGELLGLKPIKRPSLGFAGHWYQVGKSSQLHLMVLDEEISTSMRHFAIEVEDFDCACSYFKEKAVEIIEGPGKRADGSDYLFCKDPDGNLVEITKH